MISLAPFRERVAKEPLRSAIATGIVLSGFSLALSLLTLGGLRLILDSSHWGPSAATGLGGLSSGNLFFTAVLFVPLLETLIGQVIPIEFARRMGAGAIGCTLISAGVFGGGHYLNGGIAHGVTTFVAGLVFALGYLLVRHGGLRASYVAAVTAHAMHNVVALYVLAPSFPQHW